jgi:hypothetical protein
LRNFHLACELRIDHHQFRTSSTRSSLDWHRFGISPSSLLIVIFLVSDSRCLCLSKNHHSLVRLAACSHLLDDPSVAVSLSLFLRRFIVSCQIAFSHQPPPSALETITTRVCTTLCRYYLG